MSDADLVEACRRGEHAALAELIMRHARMVTAVAFARTRDDAIVEDIVQDTFVAAWQRIASLRDPAAVRPWLRKITINLASKARRTRGREVAEVERASEQTPFDTTAAHERTRAIERSLAQLSPRYREPLVLFYYEQQSIREVASALRVSELVVMRGRSSASCSMASSPPSCPGEVA